ncbi:MULTISPECIES: hypothetical protein [unclassified Polaromonas]|jgi:hypothetical protein|uniref:hypothetical protein n=1 Tax=unclassified Polaromonas TaxID=2638319 RepID=UPI000BD92CBA|nr:MULTISPECIES: hypothetical protein [unclassified Polaromonas]OYZ80504.1 MAG: hypothetical protein B7Y09_04810 [Polaromonas sp. 24-63-21]OZA89962.1 MAG: hypothetical protein B7X65_00960 [Polaromonas sp. 39-63-25]HQR97803.1 hypothetical protein [Polaromonas sp.]HQS40880.1 hypothetical protein [Polaromonas sp.]HQS86238.1 hypothetical protein [Polaromonas sp.]
MTLNIVQQRLDGLLSSSKPKVVLLTGGWGAGKTFQWKQSLKKAAADHNKPRYAYVSLFGLSSLAEIRKRVAEEIVSQVTLPGNSGTVGEVIEREGYALKPMQLLKLLPAIPVLGKLESLANELSFSAVRKAVICFDDLERAAPSLRLADVFGLASFLKEERDCRVLLISDQDKLNGEKKDDLTLYTEKVVDELIHFAPAAQTACEIALGEQPTAVRLLLQERMIFLGVSNIRVIARLAAMADELQALLAGLHEAVIKEVVHSLALFGAAYFLPKDGFPPPSFIREYDTDWRHYLKSDDQTTQTEEEKLQSVWREKLGSYGYSETSALDTVISHGVERGYFDQATVLKLATELSGTAEELAQRATYSNSWTKFWHSASGDSAALLQSLRVITDDSLRVISANDLYNACEVFKEASQEDAANALLEKFIAVNQSRPGVFSDADGPFGHIYNEAFAQRLKAEAIKHAQISSAQEALDAIDFSSGWNSKDVTRVSEVDFSELEALLLASEGRVFTKRLKTLLNIGTGSDASSKEKQVRENTIDWLRKLTTSDPILAIRLRRFIPTR